MLRDYDELIYQRHTGNSDRTSISKFKMCFILGLIRSLRNYFKEITQVC